MMRRDQIAVSGAPPGESARLELSRIDGGDRLRLLTLHDEASTGAFARVFGGDIVLGEMRTPVAVKVQRDNALGRSYDSDASTTKFNRERWLHRHLQNGISTAELEAGPVARQLEAWPFEESLPPSILCGRGRHALTPRCPRAECEAAELTEAWAGQDHERRLVCPRCQAEYAESDRRRVRDGTVGRDPACTDCPHRQGHHEACRTEAEFLNVFSVKVLLIERLDLDLEDYLAWGRLRTAPVGREGAWRLYEAHRADVAGELTRLPVTTRGLARLHRVASLFDQILTGAERLLQARVPHRDLKPANVCVRFRGPTLVAKLIDLGLADGPGLPPELRAEAVVAQGGPFTAPECAEPSFALGAIRAAFDGTRCVAVFNSSQLAPNTPGVLPGDLLFFPDADLRGRRYRVLRVQQDGPSAVKLWAVVDGGGVWLGPEVPEFALDGMPARSTEATVELHRGFPADVFSLGLTLLALLQDHPDVRAVRGTFANVQRCLEAEAARLNQLPPRAAIDLLRNKSDPYLAEYRAWDERTKKDGDLAQPLADELQGVALRACLRGPQPFYLRHRGGDPRQAFLRLRVDFDTARRALGLTAAVSAGDLQRAARTEALRTIREEARRYPPRPPAGSVRPEQVAASLALCQGNLSRADTETRYLLTAAGSAAALMPYLDNLEKDAGTSDEEDAGGEWDLVHYCIKVDLTAPDLAVFARHYGAFRRERAAAGLDPLSPAGRRAATVRAWLEEYGGIPDHLGSMTDRCVRAADAADQLARYTADVTDPNKRRYSWLAPIRFALPWGRERYERFLRALHEVRELTERLIQGLAAVDAEFKRQKTAYEAALASWRLAAAKRSAGLGRLEQTARRTWDRTARMQAEWRTQWQEAITGIRARLAAFDHVASLANAEFGQSTWLGRRRDQVTVWVPEMLASRLAEPGYDDLVDRLRQSAVAPAVALAVEFANRRADDLSAAPD